MPPLTLGALLLEMAILFACMVLFAGTYLNFSPALRPNGQDWVFLTASGGYAAEILHRSGAIPLWNPFVGMGEPMLESVLSYVLNPFMFVPIVLGGIVNGGKLAIVLHMVIMATGGWMLARVLRMRAAGRVLVGLLCLGAGGWVAAVGEGHYQIGLSQAYVPWVLAGLIGLLYLPRRWPIGVLTVAAFLLLSAGSNWYLLTTIITCALIAFFGLWDWRVEGRGIALRLNGGALRRLIIAGVLCLSISAVRAIPQYTAAEYLAHPREELTDLYTLEQVIAVYFEPTTGPAAGYWLRYNYVFPGAVLLILVALALMVRPRAPRPDFATLTVIVPALLAIILWSAFAQGGTPFVKAIYDTFPILYTWRRLGRFGAAALPLIAVLIGQLFDSLVWRVAAWRRGEQVRLGLPLLPSSLPLIGHGVPLPRFAAWALSAAIVLLGAYAGITVTQNWGSVAKLTLTDPYEGQLAGVSFIRAQNPGRFLQIDTYDIAATAEFLPALARMTVGNPEIYVFGRAPTFAEYRMAHRPVDFAAGYNPQFLQSRPAFLYNPLPGAPTFSGTPIAFAYHDPLSYAFTVSDASGETRAPFFGNETTPQTFYHHIDQITVEVGPHADRDVLVVQETAYPGWQVTVNGQPLPVESVDGLIGVRLRGTEPVSVEFWYSPPRLWIGGGISLAGFIVFTLYLLRADDWIRGRRRARPSTNP